MQPHRPTHVRLLALSLVVFAVSVVLSATPAWAGEATEGAAAPGVIEPSGQDAPSDDVPEADPALTEAPDQGEQASAQAGVEAAGPGDIAGEGQAAGDAGTEQSSPDDAQAETADPPVAEAGESGAEGTDDALVADEATGASDEPAGDAPALEGEEPGATDGGDDAAAAAEEDAAADILLDAAATASLNGVDISGWNSYWETGMAKGVFGDFVIIKATEWNSSKSSYTSYNTNYKKQADAALAKGMLIGFYHFATNVSSSGQTMAQQAQGFINAVKPYLGQALLVLDWEDASYSRVENRVDWAKQWLDYVYDKTGVRPLIYMNKSCSNSYNWSSVAGAGYELWGAQYLNAYYNEDPSKMITGFVANPTLTTGWGPWGTPLIYQYTSTAKLHGSSVYDVNKFYGSRQDWMRRTGEGRELATTAAEAAKLLTGGAIYRFSPSYGATGLVVSSSSANAVLGSASSLSGWWRVENLGGGYYRFYNLSTGKALSFNSGVANKTNVTTSGSINKWRLIRCSNGALALVPSGYDSFRLDVSGGGISTSGANIQLYRGNGTEAQRFFFTKSVGLTEAYGIGKVVDGGIYAIASASDGSKVVDIAGGSTANGANVRIYNSNNSIAQRYRLSYVGNGLYTIVSLKSGKALDVAGGSTANGANIQQYRPNSSLAQYWYLKKSGTTYTIASAASGKVLDVAGGKVASGTNIQLYRGNGTVAQRFSLSKDAVLTEAAASGKAVSEGIYTLLSAAAATKAVDIKGGSTANAANVQLYNANSSQAQKFELIYLGNGLYTIRSAKSGRVLDVAGGSTASGANVRQYTDNGSRAQMWYVTKASGSWQLRSALSGHALTLEGGGTANGTNLCVMTKSGSSSQLFTLRETPLFDDGRYTFRSSLGNYRLSVRDASTERGANVQIWETSSNPAQRWVLRYLESGQYAITNLNSGLALEVAGASSAAGANVRQGSYSGAASQRWVLSVSSSGATIVRNAASGLVLDVAGAMMASGTNVRQYTANNTGAQSFVLSRA